MNAKHLTRVSVLLVAGIVMGCSQQQDPSPQSPPAASVAAPTDHDEYIPEVLPPHLANRVAVSREALGGGADGSPLYGMIAGLKVWPPETRVLSVCFFRGNPQLRHRIVQVAKRWMDKPVGIALDFGDAPRYRDCVTSGNDQIRVGFQYTGYWSLVGQDSYTNSSQEEQSMNFQGFLVRPPVEREFTRVVLHEFGHALGFEHEHQHPWSSCSEEFDMPAITAYLSGPPNYWDSETIRHNMEEESADGKVMSQFDPHSVMLYSFPVQFYKLGVQSRCYTPGNFSLSTGDVALLAQVYPVDQKLRFARLSEDVDAYVSALHEKPGDNAEKATALDELVKFTRGRLPSDALKGIPARNITKELRDARPMQ